MNEWAQRWRRNPDNFDANGRLTRRGFVRAMLYFIAWDIVAKGIVVGFWIAAIVFMVWSIWAMTWGIIHLCKAF